MASKKILKREDRIKREDRRMRKLFADMPANTFKLYDGLITRAAYMRITLEDYEKDLDENGYVEVFSQSDKTEPYDRERPVARLYNSMNKNYQTLMKQLSDKLPEGAPPELEREIMKFAMAGRK